MRATLTFPSSVTSELFCDFAMPGWGPFGLLPRMPKVNISISMDKGDIELFGYPFPHLYNAITIKLKGGPARTEHVYKHADGSGEEWRST